MPNKTIHKFQLYGNRGPIDLPIGAQPRHFGMQDGNFMLWAEVDGHESGTTTWEFQIVGTGEWLLDPNPLRYVGTVFDEVWVWHLYMRPAPRALESDHGH